MPNIEETDIMRTWACAILLALLTTTGALAEEPTGIRWETDLEAGLRRAALEGRPVLFAINALETESANQRLATQLYRSKAWGEASHGYVCFACNPNTHGDGTACTRYGGIPCDTHRRALTMMVRRFAPVDGALISPQHIILEPDGAVAWRKQYYTGVVGPDLLERYWVRIAPELAYERADALRREKIDALDVVPVQEAAAAARAWLRTSDALATAGVLRAIDFASDDARRRELIGALDAARAAQLPVVDLLADDLGGRVNQQAYEALRLADALLAADRGRGVRLLARIATRTEDAGVRRKALARWKPEGKEEEAARMEVALLTGERRTTVLSTDDLSPLWRRRLARAQLRAGKRSRLHPPLGEALEGHTPGDRVGALLEASPDEVRAHVDAVRRLLETAPLRTRIAASIALLGAECQAKEPLELYVWWGVTDALEGPEWRAAAVARLGDDPGDNEEVWREAVRKKLGGGR